MLVQDTTSAQEHWCKREVKYAFQHTDGLLCMTRRYYPIDANSGTVGIRKFIEYLLCMS